MDVIDNSNSSDDVVTSTAADTLDLLETRLRRIEYLFTGKTNWIGEPEKVSPPPASTRETVAARLAVLENELKRLSGNAPAVRDVLTLYSRFPDLFQTPTSDTIPTTLSTQSLASIVLSYATAFPETASRLSSLQDIPVPSASASASLAELQPRLDRLMEVQNQQGLEVAELRARSAGLMKRWMEVGIIGGGEVWGDWEERVKLVERGVRRREVVQE